MTAAPAFAYWLSAAPELGEFGADVTALRQHIADGEELLAELPAKPDRDADQRRAAETIHDECRRLRWRFMRTHAATVYDELTRRRTVYRRLEELVADAAEAFPGLVPTAAQLAAERQYGQEDKEGREIDQGIFVSNLLRVPEVGRHLAEAMLRPCPRALTLAAEFGRTGRVDLGRVRVDRVDGVAHLTVANLRCLNAEDDALIDDMETAVDLALLDPGVRVGTLRGAPMTHPKYWGRRVFSAGINLRDLHAGQLSYVGFLLRREFGYLNKLLHGLLPDGDAWPPPLTGKPWLAAVDTFAIGGGMQLALLFDYVVAGADAFFSLPAAKEGIVPGAGNFRLTRIVGARLNRRIVLGGEKVWASEPAGRLLCDAVVDPAEVDDAIPAGVAQLDSPAVAANRHMLNLSDEPLDRFCEYFADFAMIQAQRLYSPDVLAKVAGAWRPRETAGDTP